MPRDEWLNARLRSEARKRARVHRGRLNRTGKRLTADEIKMRFNRHSLMGFGRYSNCEIQAVPRSYLQWLVNTASGKRRARMQALIEYLKDYLKNCVSL